MVSKRKSKEKTGSPLKITKAEEKLYQKELNKLGKQMITQVKEYLLPYLKAQQPSYVSDGISDQLEFIFFRMNATFTGAAMASFSTTTAQKMVSGVTKTNKRIFEKSIQKMTGVDFTEIRQAEGLDDFIELNVNKNVKLIKSLPDEYFKQIETIVNNGVASGQRYNVIAQEIAEATTKKVTGRIKTIARNEVQTINAQINKRRSEALGIREGIYITSDDEKVRTCHNELKGVKFRLSQGAWSKKCQKYIQPGITDINCRCTYRPIINIS